MAWTARARHYTNARSGSTKKQELTLPRSCAVNSCTRTVQMCNAEKVLTALIDLKMVRSVCLT